MGKTKNGVYPWQLGPLRTFLPCRCNEEVPACTYNISTRTSSSYVYGDGPKVVYVQIECNNCGRTNRQDIEEYNILEKDLDF